MESGRLLTAARALGLTDDSFRAGIATTTPATAPFDPSSAAFKNDLSFIPRGSLRWHRLPHASQGLRTLLVGNEAVGASAGCWGNFYDLRSLWSGDCFGLPKYFACAQAVRLDPTSPGFCVLRARLAPISKPSSQITSCCPMFRHRSWIAHGVPRVLWCPAFSPRGGSPLQQQSSTAAHNVSIFWARRVAHPHEYVCSNVFSRWSHRSAGHFGSLASAIRASRELDATGEQRARPDRTWPNQSRDIQSDVPVRENGEKLRDSASAEVPSPKSNRGGHPVAARIVTTLNRTNS